MTNNHYDTVSKAVSSAHIVTLQWPSGYLCYSGYIQFSFFLECRSSTAWHFWNYISPLNLERWTYFFYPLSTIHYLLSTIHYSPFTFTLRHLEIILAIPLFSCKIEPWLKKKQAQKLIAPNKTARINYEIGDIYEAGIVLTGTEVKSLRAGKANLKDSYAVCPG